MHQFQIFHTNSQETNLEVNLGMRTEKGVSNRLKY
jgi:hypothetical protein